MKICRVLLWCYVVLFGIEIGAGLYEMRVIVPRWPSHPPESVRQFHQLNVDYPSLATNPGEQFWVFTTPGLALLALLTFGASFATRGAHRRYLLLSTTMTLVGVIATFAYFGPHLMQIERGAPELTDQQVTATVLLWVQLNGIRALVYIVAWLLALRVLPLRPTSEP